MILFENCQNFREGNDCLSVASHFNVSLSPIKVVASLHLDCRKQSDVVSFRADR